MDWKTRVYCGDLGPAHEGGDVLLMGWVDAIRDHGNVLFIHLRDVRGIVQVVFNPEFSGPAHDEALNLKEEYVVAARGTVFLRQKGTENPYLHTGGVEVFARELKILSDSRPLPFKISEKAMVFGEALQSSPEKVDEELRLRYRYLDLRRPSMQEILTRRHRILSRIRAHLDGLGFVEVETPFLTKSTPEGARDYLVPSRIHPGKFYALPQSPQLFKQILMMSGTERYFQIVRCFRDEDLRPNRQPEFTQLDLEASFIDESFICEVVEGLTIDMFAMGGVQLITPFPRMTYEQSMARYGTDRPDLRFDMAFEEITDIVRDTDYTIFRQVVEQGGMIKGFCVRGQARSLSKNLLQNEYAMKIVPSFGAKGMTWMKMAEGRLQSNIVQFFSPKEQQHIVDRFGARDGDVLMMIADVSPDLVHKVLSDLRLHVADRLGLIPRGHFCPVWITDFPLFELKGGTIGSQHHPFTMPDRTDFDPADRDELLSLKSRAYDLVINGEELGGGSIRIHQLDLQKKIFQALDLSPQEAEEKFGFFLEALAYGTPPHGGLALGLDRVVAMILGAESIRDVMAFPKNRSAVCPLTRAPAEVKRSQLRELGLDARAATDKPVRIYTRADRREVPAHETVDSRRISRSEVRHVAQLARLKMTDPEAESFQEDLNSVLEYVETLQELDTEKVAAMSHVLGIKNVWRDDTPRKSRAAQEIVSNAPSRDGDYLKVPKIIDG